MKKLLFPIVILILAIVLCIGIYFFYHHSNPSNSRKPIHTYQTMKVQPTVMASNNVYQVMPSGKLGPIFTDTKGKTLYINKQDTKGVGICIRGCLKAWPAYVAQSQNGDFPDNISVIKRSDGILQYAWKGMPLYYFANDKKAGDVNGEGIGGVWSVVK